MIRALLLSSLAGLVACATTPPVEGTTSADVTDDTGTAPVPVDSTTINTCTTHCPDLVLDADLLSRSVVIESREFPDPAGFPQDMPHVGADCSVSEGSVGAPGVRRLLRFSTGATNIGTGDLLLGDPTDASRARFFVYAPCHGHYHFSGFANYRLLAPDGSVALDGHKQAFCIEDNIDKLQVDPHPAHPTNCGGPGLHRGWSDVYYNHTEANWIDITGLAAGDYTLVVTLNDERVIHESDYDNNSAQVSVTIADDPSPEICPADTEALFRCVGENPTSMSRCYAGRRDTEVCVDGTSCAQPSEIAHQAHCGNGGSASVSSACPDDVSTVPYCTEEVDPLSGDMKSVRKWCDGGTIETEYCGTGCADSGLGYVLCQ